MRLVSLMLVASLALTTAACTEDEKKKDGAARPRAASTKELAAFYAQKPVWRKCGAGFECTTVQVPVDYAKPAGERIELAVNRRPAGNGSARIGSLVTNPGGPGGSGLEFVTNTVKLFGKDVQDRFDIVGFDPRGVGKSDPVQCLNDQEKHAYSTVSVPKAGDQAGLDRYVVEMKRLAAGCSRSPHLAHVGTVNAARDMDVLRAALGDPKLTYYGASYGTYLGTIYAEQFPQNVRALVLDSAVDPTITYGGFASAQVKGFDTALRAFVTDCVKRPDCPLGTGDVDTALGKIEILQGVADQGELHNSVDKRTINAHVVTQGIVAAMYNKGAWPALREALAAAREGDGTPLLGFADEGDGRGENGSYSNLRDGQTAVNCADYPVPAAIADFQKQAAEISRLSPRFGAELSWPGLECTYMSAHAKEKPRTTGAPGAPPILVIGTTRDPATPYEWAQKLAAHLKSGVLLTLDGDGHGAYLQGIACIGAAADGYLLTAQPPRKDITCRTR